MKSDVVDVPKVSVTSYGCHTSVLLAFQLLTFARESDRRLNVFCPVWASWAYLGRTKGFMRSKHVVTISQREGSLLPVSVALEAVILACKSSGLQPAEDPQAYSTGGVVPSWAMLKGVFVRYLCTC